MRSRGMPRLICVVSYVVAGVAVYLLLKYMILWSYLANLIRFAEYVLENSVRQFMNDPHFQLSHFNGLIWFYLTYCFGTTIAFIVFKICMVKVTLSIVKCFPVLHLPPSTATEMVLPMKLAVSALSVCMQRSTSSEGLAELISYFKLYSTRIVFLHGSLMPVMAFISKDQAHREIRVYNLDCDNDSRITDRCILKELRSVYHSDLPAIVSFKDKQSVFKTGIFAQTMFEIRNYRVMVGLLSLGTHYEFDHSLATVIFNDMSALIGYGLSCHKDEILVRYFQKIGGGKDVSANCQEEKALNGGITESKCC